MKSYVECQEVREDFSALLDGELNTQEQEAVESHLSECSECLRELDGLNRVDSLYSAMPAMNAPEGFDESVHASLRPGRSFLWPRSARGRRILGLTLAAAAGILLMVSITVPIMNQSDRFDTAKVMSNEALQVNRDFAFDRSSESTLSQPASSPAPALEGSLDVADGFGSRSEFNEPSKSLPVVVGRNNRPPGAAFPVEQELEEMAEGEVAPADTDLRVAGRILARGDAVDSVSKLSEELPQEKEAKSFVGDEVTVAARPVPLQEQDVVVSNMREEDKSQVVGGAGGFADANDALNDVAAESGADSPSFLRARAKRASIDEEKMSAAAEEGFEGASSDSQRELRAAAEPLLRKFEAGKKDARNFEMRGDVWYESGYTGQKTVDLERDSKKWRKLLVQYPELESYAEVPEAMVFNLDGTWYLLNKIPKPETR